MCQNFLLNIWDITEKQINKQRFLSLRNLHSNGGKRKRQRIKNNHNK